VAQICACNVSPIVVDTIGKGFHFTDAQTACVTFDMMNDNNPKRYSWPEHDSGKAWLVYDRDNDNKVDSGAELFGSFTPHSSGLLDANKSDPNGFLALAFTICPCKVATRMESSTRRIRSGRS
jgi:hypothetical protein